MSASLLHVSEEPVRTDPIFCKLADAEKQVLKEAKVCEVCVPRLSSNSRHLSVCVGSDFQKL